MNWMTMIGTIAIGAVLIVSLLAIFDILFVKPASRTKKSRAPDGVKGADASHPNEKLAARVRRRQRLADKKN
jgi:hypothetical protein